MSLFATDKFIDFMLCKRLRKRIYPKTQKTPKSRQARQKARKQHNYSLYKYLVLCKKYK